MPDTPNRVTDDLGDVQRLMDLALALVAAVRDLRDRRVMDLCDDIEKVVRRLAERV